MGKNFYITTPIYYPSAKPHLGHAYSSIVADFFARFKKIQGYKVFFLTGTDEHGQKIQRAAKKRGMDPLSFCDEISKTFRDLSKTLNLSNTDFIRTTEERHKKTVQYLWSELQKMVIFIYQNIQVGIQFQMKLFTMKMKLKKKTVSIFL
jgi:methionyl-tRNA synthetase